MSGLRSDGYVENALGEFVRRNFEQTGKTPLYLSRGIALYRRGDVIVQDEVSDIRMAIMF